MPVRNRRLRQLLRTLPRAAIRHSAKYMPHPIFFFVCVFFLTDMWSHWSHLSVKVSNNLLNIFEKNNDIFAESCSRQSF